MMLSPVQWVLAVLCYFAFGILWVRVASALQRTQPTIGVAGLWVWLWPVHVAYTTSLVVHGLLGVLAGGYFPEERDPSDAGHRRFRKDGE